MGNEFKKIDIFDTPIFAQKVSKIVSEIRKIKRKKRNPFDYLYENGYFETKKFVPTLKRCLEKTEKDLSSRQRSAIVNIGARAYFMTVKPNNQ